MIGEILLNKESKSGAWEVTYDSSKEMVTLMYWKENDDEPSSKIVVTKKEFLELKSFLSSLRLTNYNLVHTNFKTNKTKTWKR